MSITVSNGSGIITVDYGTGRVETFQKGSFRTVTKGNYLYIVFNNVDNIFPKYEFGDNHSLMKDKIELLYTDVSSPSVSSAAELRGYIETWNAAANSIADEETGTTADVESLGSLKTVTPTRLAGTAFSGTTKDPNFWTETVTGSGAITQAGEILMATGATANSTAKYTSVRKARKVTGTANQFRAIARNVQTPTADCIRRIGCYGANDGFFFQYDGVTFGVGSRKGGVDTVVTNGNFNGNLGATISALFTSFARLVIEYTSLGAKFFINGGLLHTISASTTALCNTLDLGICIEVANENDNTAENSYEVLFATILRLGDLTTAPKTYHISGNAATHILKYGAGTLQKIIFNNTSGTSITIYDNTAASGTVIGVITTASAALGEWTYNAPFDTGLTLVTVGNSLDATIIYE